MGNKKLNIKYLTGFSLIEIITTIVIISILVSISVPVYTRTVERSKDNEAKSNLALIAAAEEVFKMETGSYYASSDYVHINQNLRLNLNEDNFNYDIFAIGPQPLDNFTATASRNAGGFNRTWCITEADSSATCCSGGCP